MNLTVHTSCAYRPDNLHVSHHAVVFVLEDMAVEDKTADLFRCDERDEYEDPSRREVSVIDLYAGRHRECVVPGLDVVFRVGGL